MGNVRQIGREFATKKYVFCRECGKALKEINANHLKKHKMSLVEYLKKYPYTQTTSTDKLEAISKSSRECIKNGKIDMEKVRKNSPIYNKTHNYRKERKRSEKKLKIYRKKFVEPKCIVMSNCSNCGKEIRLTKYQYNHGRRYCSWKCFKEHRNLVLTCKQCGKKFKRWKKQVEYEKKKRGATNVFCSQECNFLYRKGKPVGPHTKEHCQKISQTKKRKFADRWVETKCFHCGKKIRIHKHSSTKHNFCNIKCYNKKRSYILSRN